MRASLKRRAEAGAGLILSSHQLELVSAMCDRVLIVSKGEELLTGTIEEIRARYPSLCENATLEDVFLHAMGHRGDEQAEASPAVEAVEAEAEATQAEAETVQAEAVEAEAVGDAAADEPNGDR
jgi:ABC-type uncharacterized transport system ATPase subunit